MRWGCTVATETSNRRKLQEATSRGSRRRATSADSCDDEQDASPERDCSEAAHEAGPENSPAETNSSLLLRLRATNLHDAKLAFFESGCTVAPRFTYSNEITRSTQGILNNQNVCFSLLPEAKLIMERAREQYGSLIAFRECCYGSDMCDAEELESSATKYLEEHGIQGLVETQMVADTLSVACVTKPFVGGKYVLNLCAGLAFRGMVQSICDHEIGTHLLRMINDEDQVWHNKRKRYGFASLCALQTTEEGLATLNTCFSLPCKLLHEYALRYHAVCYGARFGFVELYHELRGLDVDAENCWQLCCRVKRGLIDTSMPGAFWRDQSYFKGAVEILQYLQRVDFEHKQVSTIMKLLYSGRIAHQDLERVPHFVDREASLTLPHFLRTASGLRVWIQHCQEMIQENQLGELCSGQCAAPAGRSKSAPSRGRGREKQVPQQAKNEWDSSSPKRASERSPKRANRKQATVSDELVESVARLQESQARKSASSSPKRASRKPRKSGEHQSSVEAAAKRHWKHAESRRRDSSMDGAACQGPEGGEDMDTCSSPLSRSSATSLKHVMSKCLTAEVLTMQDSEVLREIYHVAVASGRADVMNTCCTAEEHAKQSSELLSELYHVAVATAADKAGPGHCREFIYPATESQVRATEITDFPSPIKDQTREDNAGEVATQLASRALCEDLDSKVGKWHDNVGRVWKMLKYPISYIRRSRTRRRSDGAAELKCNRDVDKTELEAPSA